jgi:DNA-binding XRE family transcriptional regulator
MSNGFDPVRARRNRGLTQRAAAKAAQVPYQTIQRIEKGLGAHPENAKRVADFYGVLVTDLPAFAPEPPVGPRVVREDYRADGVLERESNA